MYVDKPPSGINLPGTARKGNEGGVVEGFGSCKVITADHHVGEHCLYPVLVGVCDGTILGEKEQQCYFPCEFNPFSRNT